MMPFDDDDELRRQLTSLASDLDGLPGPSAARRRAAQRTRNQITGGVAAGVAVVALGGLGIVQFFGAAPSQMEPTDPTTPPATTEPTTATPADEIPDTALLIPEDIDTAQRLEWTETRIEELPDVECVPDLPEDVLATRSVGYAGPRMQPDPAPDEFTNPTVRHDLLRVEPGTAADVQAALVGALNDCVPNQQGTTDSRPRWLDRFTVDNVGDQMGETRYWADPVYGDFFTQVEYSVVAADDLVSIVTRTHLNTEAHGAPDYVTPTNAAHRACLAIHDETCVTGEPVPDGLGDYPEFDPGESPDSSEGNGDETGGEPGDDTGSGTEDGTGDPTGDPTDPTPTNTGDGESPGNGDDPTAIDEEPFLPAVALNPIGSYGDGWELTVTDDEAEETVTLDHANACVDSMPATDVIRHGTWSNGIEGMFSETVLQLDSAADAATFVDAHSARPQPCAASSDPTIEVTNTDPDAVPVGDAAYAWFVEYTPTPDNAGTSTSFFGAAIAHRDNIVVILTFGAMSDPMDGGWTSWVESRVGTALDAAVSE